MNIPVITTYEDGVWTVMPNLPNVTLFGLGKSRRAAEADLKKALAVYFGHLDDCDRPIPKPLPVYSGSLRMRRHA